MAEVVEIDDSGSIGVITDTPSYQVPPEAWTGGTNMRVVDSGMERLRGWSQVFGELAAGNDSFTKVLLHLDGADAGTVITDDNAGGSAHVWTAAGNANTDTAQMKFGVTSLGLDGTGDFVSTPDSSDFLIATNMFATDMWVRFASTAGTQVLIRQGLASGSLAFTLEFSANFLVLALSADGTNITSTTGAWTPSLNTWYHVAATRDVLNVTRLFIDGVIIGTGVDATNVFNSAASLVVGALSSGGAAFNGWIDEVRLSIGTPRWTVAFTPPTRSYLTAMQTLPHFAMAVRTASATFWLYTSLTKAFAYDGSTHVEVTRASGDYTASITAQWNGTLLADVPILNNGNDVPQYWPTIALATPLADLPNWPATLRARVVRAFGPYLMAIGISKSGVQFPHTVKWSHPADPGSVPSSWDETDPSVEAGETPLPDVHAGILLDMLPLGDTMYIYKENSVRKCRFIGGRDIFDFGKSAWLETTGILAARCVCITGDGTKQVWASQDDILWHDGNRVRSLLTERRRRELFDSIDTANYANSFMFTNPLYGEVWFCYPPSGQSQPTKALIFNYLRGGDQWPITDADGITFRNASIGPIQGASDEQWNQGTDTWDDDTGPWSTLQRRRVVLCGTDATKFYNLDDGATRDGVVFTGTLQRLGLSVLGKKRNGEWVVDFDRMKMYDTLWPKLKSGIVSIRIGSQQLVNGPVTWNQAIVYDPTTDIKVDAGPISGRALALEISGATSWHLDGFKAAIQDLGMF